MYQLGRPAGGGDDRGAIHRNGGETSAAMEFKALWHGLQCIINYILIEIDD